MAEKEQAAAAVAGAGVGSLITYFVTHPREVRAAPPEGMDEATWNMILALIDGIALQSQKLNELTASIDSLVATLGGPAVVDDPFASMPKFVVGHVLCPVANRGYRLPSMPIPKNKQLVVTALPGNITWLWVANTQADSTNMNVAYPLVPTAGVGLFVKNANAVWVMATTINDGAAFIVEQE